MLRILLVCSLLIPLLVFAGGAYLGYRSTLAQARLELQRFAATAELQIANILDTHLLAATAVEGLVDDVTAAEVTTNAQLLDQQVTASIRKFPQVQAVWLLDEPGHVMLEAGLGERVAALDAAALDRGALRDPDHNVVFSSLQGGPGSDRFYFLIARPVQHLFSGSVVTAVASDYFVQFFSQLLAHRSDYGARVLRRDGETLVRYPAIDAQTAALPRANSAISAVMRGDLDQGFVEGLSDTTGFSGIIAYRRLANYPVYVTVGRSWESILAEWRDLMMSHLYFGVPATLSLMVLTLVALRYTRRETMAMARAREAMRQREAAEEALRQSQKMESLGQLTGGISHDFNNLLTVILGNLETLSRRLPESQSHLRPLVDLATRGAERAAVLTQRLLAFSRRQPLAPKPVNLNRLVVGISDLLARTLGETIAIETVLSAGLWPASIDANQLESALVNLAVNARDAMPRGGKLTIETSNAYIDEPYAAANADAKPGQYVLLAVSDTGVGMTKEVIAHAFEPFFTTKETGHGTGLGLSQVYGFIKQSGGHVKIYSEVGEGSTVKLYLPRLVGEDAEVEPPAPARPAPAAGRRETILVVEDDEDVRAYSVDTLRELGYRVEQAADARVALQLLERDPEIRLLFTDVGLPGGINGRQLVDEARRRRPDLKVLFTTGYARNAIVHQGRLDPGVELLVKPFSFAGLAGKVRQILDAP
ncbi:MAG TPA: ATP-binding protein [Stellaceae bacterium]|nr:ATP-binding protein [Stellaceae bacterium]